MNRAMAGIIAGMCIAGVFAYTALGATDQNVALGAAGLFFICAGFIIWAGKENNPFAGIFAGISFVGIIIFLLKDSHTVDIFASGLLGTASLVFFLAAVDYITL